MTSVSTFAPVLIPLFLFGSPVASASTSQVNEGYLKEEKSPAVRRSQPSSISASSIPPSGPTWVDASAEVLVPALAASEWLLPASEEVYGFLGLADGWKGPDSLAPVDLTATEAVDLLWQLSAEIVGMPQPAISADEDGAICMHWRMAGLLATMTVYGDGTYSFYAEAGELSAKSDSELVGLPLPADLISVLISGSTAA